MFSWDSLGMAMEEEASAIPRMPSSRWTVIWTLWVSVFWPPAVTKGCLSLKETGLTSMERIAGILVEEAPEIDHALANLVSGFHFLERFSIFLLKRNLPDDHPRLRGLDDLATAGVESDVS